MYIYCYGHCMQKHEIINNVKSNDEVKSSEANPIHEALSASISRENCGVGA